MKVFCSLISLVLGLHSYSQVIAIQMRDLSFFEMLADSTPPATKSKQATASVKGDSDSFCFYFNPKEWTLLNFDEQGQSSPSIKKILTTEAFAFESTQGKLKATLKAENASVPIKEIKSLVWEDAEDKFDQVSLFYEDTRKVNNLRIYCYKWKGYLGSDPYLGQVYVYRRTDKFVKVTVMGPESEFMNRESAVTDFLNGLSECH